MLVDLSGAQTFSIYDNWVFFTASTKTSNLPQAVYYSVGKTILLGRNVTRKVKLIGFDAEIST